MIAPGHEIALPGQKTIIAEPDLRLRQQAAVGRDVAVVSQINGAFLAGQDRVAADHGVGPDPDPLVGLALGVQDGPVVDERVVPDFNLVRMAEDDVPAEDDAPADLPKDPGEKGPAENQPQRAGDRGDEEIDEFVLQQGRQTPFPDA